MKRRSSRLKRWQIIAAVMSLLSTKIRRAAFFRWDSGLPIGMDMIFGEKVHWDKRVIFRVETHAKLGDDFRLTDKRVSEMLNPSKGQR